MFEFEALDTHTQEAIASAFRGGMPRDMVAAFVRWAQLETWLRTLVHLELAAAHGRSWTAHLTGKARSRKRSNAINSYMLSPDEDSLLAYGDVADLFGLIDDNWALFESALVTRVRWQGWADELRSIRNRIAHCRRPHLDDVPRLEQILRNLESGAKRALSAYNTFLDVRDNDSRLPQSWSDNSAAWSSIARHARGQYHTNFRVEFSARPWGRVDQHLLGTPGVLVHARWHTREGYVVPRVVWSDLLEQDFDQSLIVHYVQDIASTVEVVFAGIDDADEVAEAIELSFQAILGNIERYDDRDEFMNWKEAIETLDPRCHIDDAFSHADRLHLFSVFGAERGVRTR